MTTLTSPAAAGGAPSRVDAFYFAAWRWHFYAGLFVAPFLGMLALTGLLMLWVSSTTDLNGERARVPVGEVWLPPSALAEAALAAVPEGSLMRYVAPRREGRVALLQIASPEGERAVLVDPYTAEVTGIGPWGNSLYTLASDIHGTLLIGTTGDRLIEIAAGFGVVLIATGLALWWPRGGEGWRAVLLPRLAARGRAAWKSWHRAAGFWVSGLLLVFLISGLSWAGIWGDRFVQAWNTFPAEKWSAPLSDLTHASLGTPGEAEVPWGLEDAPLPQSGSEAGAAGVTAPVTLDKVADLAESLGLPGRYQINLPQGETGVWTISHDTMSNDGGFATSDRTLHIDRYSGAVLADVGYGDYSPYAKAMAWGIAFHEGDLGGWNLALNTLFCLVILGLSVSGLVLWWKRRPKGALRLAAPPRPAEVPLRKGAVLVGLAVSMAFPLVGLTLLGLLALDLLVIARLPALQRALR